LAPSIDIDEDVWAELQALAVPLVDTPNSVLRRILGLEGNPDPELSGSRQRATRAPAGSLLPESAYEVPILRVLADRGGRAPARDVVHAVGEIVSDELTELDREPLPNGAERWQSRIQFSRLRMKQKGLLKSGSPRGIWELADDGAAALSKHRAPN